MSEYVYAGLTSQTIDLFIRDSSSSTGQGLTGLAYNSGSLVASYRKGATGSRVAITLATQTVGGAFSSGGFVEIDATNMPGCYRLDLPNAAVDTAGFVTVFLKGATNMVPVALRIDCRPLPADVKQFGGTNLTAASGIPEVKVASMAANTLTAAAIAADAGAEIAALVETYIVNEGDATAVMQAIANLIAADWVAGDASPLAIAAAVRTNLATELARIDEAISTRLAAAGYTAPANSDIAAIKSKSDQLTFTTANKVDSTAVLDSAVGTQIDNIENAAGWLLAINSGACANPQTSAEQYDITAFGVAFRVVMAGQTSTGIRTAPTLSKP